MNLTPLQEQSNDEHYKLSETSPNTVKEKLQNWRFVTGANIEEAPKENATNNHDIFS